LADDKNTTLEQFKSFAAMADERMDKLEIGKADKVSPVSFIIPAEGWTSVEIDETGEEETGASYPYYIDIAVPGVTAWTRADITIAVSSHSAAASCGLCPTSETLEGKIRLRAVSAPTEEISAEYWLHSGKE